MCGMVWVVFDVCDFGVDIIFVIVVKVDYLVSVFMIVVFVLGGNLVMCVVFIVIV